MDALMTRFFIFTTLAAILFASSVFAVEFQTYVTARQVEDIFSDEARQQQALDAFKQLGIETVILESIRSGRAVDPAILRSGRNLLKENGFRVTAGVATIRGGDFGVASDQPGIWLNYEHEKTQRDLAEHIREIAAIFDTIIIDDFLATDDMSELSRQAKGDRTWSDYRLELMTDISRDCIIAPAREVNSDVVMILKYPQWYDRFHKFGYNVETGPQLYDRIWAGTETRNPDTVRFGFVQPTQGFINYSWLRSMAGEKMGGAWFDFGDCTPEVFLMQAYQSVLAGARELTLFEAGSLIANNECITPFRERRHAVAALGEILDGFEMDGVLALKPPHSDGSDAQGGANLYIFDYLATFGIPIVMTSKVPDDNDKPVLLTRHAAHLRAEKPEDDARRFIAQPKTIATVDYINTLDDEHAKLAGYDEAIELSGESETVSRMIYERYDDDGIHIKKWPVDSQQLLRLAPAPELFQHQIRAQTDSGQHLLFSAVEFDALRVINLATFQHEEFQPGKEQFLPPRKLFMNEFKNNLMIQISNLISEGTSQYRRLNNASFTVFHNENKSVWHYVIANFNDKPISGEIFHARKQNEIWNASLNKNFPHVEGTVFSLIDTKALRNQVKIMPWELAVVTFEKVQFKRKDKN